MKTLYERGDDLTSGFIDRNEAKIFIRYTWNETLKIQTATCCWSGKAWWPCLMSFEYYNNLPNIKDLPYRLVRVDTDSSRQIITYMRADGWRQYIAIAWYCWVVKSYRWLRAHVFSRKQV